MTVVWSSLDRLRSVLDRFRPSCGAARLFCGIRTDQIHNRSNWEISENGTYAEFWCRTKTRLGEVYSSTGVGVMTASELLQASLSAVLQRPAAGSEQPCLLKPGTASHIMPQDTLPCIWQPGSSHIHPSVLHEDSPCSA